MSMHRWLAFALVAAAAPIGARFLQTPSAPERPLPFVRHAIDTGMTGGYQVVIADLNRDRRPDIVAMAIGLKELRWYENPGWQKHVLAPGLNSMINVAAHDVDGDGIVELALAHEFSTVHARSLGIISILTHGADPTAPWTMQEIDRVPTSHRLRFVDAEGDGRKVLVNAPLVGPQALAPDYRDKVSLFWYRPGEWKRLLVTDAEEGVVHGILPASWSDRPGEAVLTASFLGIHALEFEQGRWRRSLVTRGDPGAWPRSGASDVAVVRIGSERMVATIEPWHGNQLVVHRRLDGSWIRRVIDDSIVDAHTIVAGDFDGDGRDEIVAGERGGRRSAYLYRADPSGDTWSRQVLDDGMAAAGCDVGDLNADGRADIVCIGTATANLNWYENAGAR
jgi:hypothetical protein